MTIRRRGLALDLGTTTGWAIDARIVPRGGEWDARPIAGIWDCSHSGDDLGEAYSKLERHLIKAIHHAEPDYVAKEAAVMMRWGKTNAAASRMLIGMAGIVELVTWRLGIACYDVNLMTARKHFVGNARASKSDVWHACQINGWPAKDLNACDAICVLAYGRACHGTQQILGKTVTEKRAQGCQAASSRR